MLDQECAVSSQGMVDQQQQQNEYMRRCDAATFDER